MTSVQNRQSTLQPVLKSLSSETVQERDSGCDEGELGSTFSISIRYSGSLYRSCKREGLHLPNNLRSIPTVSSSTSRSPHVRLPHSAGEEQQEEETTFQPQAEERVANQFTGFFNLTSEDVSLAIASIA